MTVRNIQHIDADRIHKAGSQGRQRRQLTLQELLMLTP